jgi:2,3-bisphosphoglycerate-independent phosphoglycerate mutase
MLGTKQQEITKRNTYFAVHVLRYTHRRENKILQKSMIRYRGKLQVKEVPRKKEISNGDPHKLGYFDHTEMKSNRMKCRQNTSQGTKESALLFELWYNITYKKGDKEPINLLIQKQFSSLLKLNVIQQPVPFMDTPNNPPS